MITSILSNDLAYALAWTLVHSLWQFTLVALVLTLLLRIFKKVDPNYRYFISFGSLGICSMMSLITFGMYYSGSTAITQTLYSQVGYNSLTSNTQALVGLSSFLAWIETYLNVIVNAWVIGSLLFFLKFTGAYLYLKSIVKKSKYSNKSLTKSLKKIKSKFEIHRNVSIKESLQISTPMVIGYVKPVILFPMGLINQLSIAEVNAILAHELAHIKRHDYLFNIIQISVEILFYYHPAIWYISSRIRLERENCCDDMAIAYTKNNVSYAKTLVKLQELNMKNIQPALAFSGHKKSFTNRILRLLNETPHGPVYKDKIMVALLLFTTLFVGAKNYHQEEVIEKEEFDVYVIDDCPQAPEDIKYYLDTIPDRNSFHIKKKSKKQELELEMENGEITKLKIDGREVPSQEINEHESILEELIPDGERDIITLFPDCGDDFGKVYLLEKLSRKAINMDSILESLKDNNDVFSKWKNQELYGFNFEDYDDLVIDTIRDEISIFNFDNEFDPKKFPGIFVDSIWDLVPHKMPRLFSYRNELFEKDTENLLNELLNKDDDKLMNWLEKSKHDLFEDNISEWVNKDFDVHEFLKNKKSSERLFKSTTVADVITNKLLKDGLIDEDGDTSIELTGKFMKVDGDKQPSNIWKKYKKIYEKETGIMLSKDSKIKFEILDSQKNKRKGSLFGI